MEEIARRNRTSRTATVRLTNCPTCPSHPRFEQLGPAAFTPLQCPGCGQTIDQAIALLKRDRKPVPVKRKEAPVPQVSSNGNGIEARIHHTAKRYSWVTQLAAAMMEQRGVVGKILVKNTYSTKHTYNRRTKEHKLIFGAKTLDDGSRFGFLEYSTWQWLWPEYGYGRRSQMKGMQAVWATVIHEVAHLIQVHDRGRERGKVHTPYWGQVVKLLQKEWPWEKVQPIAERLTQ